MPVKTLQPPTTDFSTNELGGKIFCSGFFFCREKKYLPPCTLSPSVTRVVFYYNKNQGEFIFGPVFLVIKFAVTRVVFYYNVLGGKIFCSGFFSAAKKILASKIKITEK